MVGTNEAQAIAMEIEKVFPNRPMTHDLFKHFSLKFDFKIKEIFISDIKEGVFYSKIVCFNSKKEIFIAVHIERLLTKDEILELYLNKIYSFLRYYILKL